MKIFLCEELRALHHNKRNWFPSYLDHYSNSSIREINLYNVTNVCKIHPTKSQVIGKKGCKYCLFCPYISSVMPFFIYRAVGITFSGQKICDFIWWPTIAMDGGFWMHRKLTWGNEGDMFAGYSFRAK